MSTCDLCGARDTTRGESDAAEWQRRYYRLMAKHKKFALETNRLLTEMAARWPNGAEEDS